MLKLNDFLARLWIHNRNRSTSHKRLGPRLCFVRCDTKNEIVHNDWMKKVRSSLNLAVFPFGWGYLPCFVINIARSSCFKRWAQVFKGPVTHVANKIKDIACQADLGHMKYLYNDTLGTVRNEHIKREINLKRIIFVFGYQFDQ